MPFSLWAGNLFSRSSVLKSLLLIPSPCILLLSLAHSCWACSEPCCRLPVPWSFFSESVNSLLPYSTPNTNPSKPFQKCLARICDFLSYLLILSISDKPQYLLSLLLLAICPTARKIIKWIWLYPLLSYTILHCTNTNAVSKCRFFSWDKAPCLLLTAVSPVLNSHKVTHCSHSIKRLRRMYCYVLCWLFNEFPSAIIPNPFYSSQVSNTLVSFKRAQSSSEETKGLLTRVSTTALHFYSISSIFPNMLKRKLFCNWFYNSFYLLNAYYIILVLKNTYSHLTFP